MLVLTRLNRRLWYVSHWIAVSLLQRLVLGCCVVNITEADLLDIGPQSLEDKTLAAPEHLTYRIRSEERKKS
jgi:hypothetical protein